MAIKQLITKLFIYEGPPAVEPFSLDETEKEQILAADGEIKGDVASGERHRRKSKKPRKAKKIKDLPGAEESWEIDIDFFRRRERVESIFHLPLNKDVVIRELTLGIEPGLEAFLVFLEGMADKQVINNNILEPLMLLSNLDHDEELRLLGCKKVLKRYLPSNQVKEISNYKEVLKEVTNGSTVVFIEGCQTALSCETKGFASRNVDTAKTEQVVQGPQEGFVENMRFNTSLLRKILRTEKLIAEYLSVGTRNNTNVAIMYLLDIASPKLVQEVKRRVSSVEADYIAETGILEEFIEDHPFSLVPQTIKTERPDRVASHLAEGKVAIIVDNTPFVMIVPVTFFAFLHSPEDHYVRFPYGFWLRILRVVAIFLTLLLPAFYIAVATFHQEMIPTDLLLAISAAKERVPFPTPVEILLMELSFELIREAGVRVPGVIGPTLGIVGTLILGQAAVSAAIVSPISIIIVAVTGLSSFAIPNYSVAFGFRFMRFMFVFLASVLGFFGISCGLFVLLGMLISMNSFGVPFFAPVAPRTAPSADVILRQPAWSQEQRPDYVQALEVGRQPNISRGWVKPKHKKDQGKLGSGGGQDG